MMSLTTTISMKIDPYGPFILNGEVERKYCNIIWGSNYSYQGVIRYFVGENTKKEITEKYLFPKLHGNIFTTIENEL